MNALAGKYSSLTQLLRAGVGLLALGAVALAQAQTPASNVNPAEFVNQRLAIWQQRLKLDSWQISVVMLRRHELKSRTLGGIRWDKHKKTAVITVLDPADYRLPLREMLEDMELTLVHELVHLELASLPRSEASRGSEEHAVNRLAEALLKLGRQQ